MQELLGNKPLKVNRIMILAVTTQTFLAYLSTVLIFMITPGPSQLLMLSNSLKYGYKKSRFTALGDLTANSFQMTLASAGLASILYSSEYAFLAIKWFGVAYLVFLGIKQIRKTKETEIGGSFNSSKSIMHLYVQGFLSSASNPKAIVFFAALFPQFLNMNEPILGQLAILGLTYLLVDGMFLTGYGVFADWIKIRLNKRYMVHLNKVSGSFLIMAAILLGLKKIETTI